MEGIKKDGKDVCGEPQFSPHLFSSSRCGQEGILTSLGGFTQICGMNKRGGEVI